MKLLVSLFLLLLSLSTQTTVQADEALSFGIVPQQSASKLARLWGPILKYISNKSGVKLTFKTAKNIPEFEKRLYAGNYDISYMNPYHYTVAHKEAGYEVFAKQQNKRIVGILVARKDSDIEDINELNGKTLAFPSPAAFAASILPRAFLTKSGIKFTPKYVSSHDSVYRSVQLKLYPAGGGIIRTLKNVGNNVSNDLNILWKSPGYTPHALASHPRINADKISRVKKVMLEMASDPVGKKLLQNIKFKGIENGEDKEWNDIRELRIDELK